MLASVLGGVLRLGSSEGAGVGLAAGEGCAVSAGAELQGLQQVAVDRDGGAHCIKAKY